MRLWRYTGSLLTILLSVAVLTIATDGPPSIAQTKQAAIETLFGTPPLSTLPPDTSVTLNRITYRPGETLELNFPGPIMLFVESGELAVPEATPDDPTVLLYSGPDTSPPPTRSDDGDDVLPAGYAVLAESEKVGLTRNPSSEPTVVLAVFLIPENMEEVSTEVKEATASP